MRSDKDSPCVLHARAQTHTECVSVLPLLLMTEIKEGRDVGNDRLLMWNIYVGKARVGGRGARANGGGEEREKVDAKLYCLPLLDV